MIRRQDGHGAIGNSSEECIDIYFRAQGWIHFVARVEVLNRLIGQRDVMRTNFSANFHPARASFTK